MSDVKRGTSHSRAPRRKEKSRVSAPERQERVREDFVEEEEFQEPVEDREPERDLRDDRDEDADTDDEFDDDRDEGDDGVDAPARVQPKLGDDFVLQCWFDAQSRQFVASSPEVIGVRASGTTREAAIRSLEGAIGRHLQQLKGQGKNLPDAIYSKNYPEKLDVAISQGLFRKLDLLSRQERVSLDQLVIELLSSAVEKRAEKPAHKAHSGGGGHHQSHRHHQGGGGGGHRGRPQNRHGGGGHSGNSRGNNRDRDRDRDGNRHVPNGNRRSSNDMLESRDNFLEYVRNLEKSGGTHRRGWKK